MVAWTGMAMIEAEWVAGRDKIRVYFEDKLANLFWWCTRHGFWRKGGKTILKFSVWELGNL